MLQLWLVPVLWLPRIRLWLLMAMGSNLYPAVIADAVIEAAIEVRASSAVVVEVEEISEDAGMETSGVVEMANSEVVDAVGSEGIEVKVVASTVVVVEGEDVGREVGMVVRDRVVALRRRRGLESFLATVKLRGEFAESITVVESRTSVKVRCDTCLLAF